jgi:hypothetical protein
MNNSIHVKFPVKSFRKIPNPAFTSNNGSETKPEMYILIADVKDVPNNIPLETNPRYQNLDTKVAKKIKESLLSPTEHNFYLLNRGLLLSAGSISYDNINSCVTIDFDDTNVHGDVDGGHTYRVILENRAALAPNSQFVKIEVLTGVEDFFEQLAAARNTSLQVKDTSIGDLERRFELVKTAIQKEPYANNINYKENGQKDIDIQDMLALFFMFNLERFPNGSSSYPIAAYAAKRSCLQDYLENHKKGEKNGQIDNPYYKMMGVMPDIIRLFDDIEVHIPEFYKGESGSNKRYGSVIGVAMAKKGKSFESKYLKTPMDYATPNGFLYPMLGAFRALLEEKNGVYVWKKNPFLVLNEIGPTLANNVVDLSRQLGNNPNATGKSPNLWNQLYVNVLIKALTA